jgi:hypothetical protein
MAFYAIKFQEEILKNSSSQIFSHACAEWSVLSCTTLDEDDDPEFCICSHEIKQLFTIQNKLTDKILTVGCDCARHIPDIEKSEIYEAALINLRDLRNKKNKKINSSLILILRDNSILPDKQIEFLEDMKRKRKISEKQEKYYNDLINKLVKLYPKTIPIGRHHSP